MSTLHKWLRILRHRWLDEGDIRRRLGSGALDRIEQAVRASEARHGGEIRLCIEAGLPLADLRAGTTPRQRAEALFAQLGVWDTDARNGVLIYLLLAERAIEIVADRGLARQVDAAEWQMIAAGMSAAFKGGCFEEGLRLAIESVGCLLDRHFPLAEGATNPNELPDSPHLR